MICNIVAPGKGFRGCLNYIFEDGKGLDGARPAIVASNMTGTTPRELAREFAFARARRPDVKRPVAHLILNLHPRDGRLGDARWGMLVRDFMDAMGFSGHQWVAGHHGEKSHDHAHIVASRIGMPSGKVWKSSNDRRKAQQVCALLEEKYGLSSGSLGLGKSGPRLSKGEIESAARLKRLPGRVEMHAQVTAALKGKPSSLAEFRDRLAGVGIEVRAHLDQSGKVIRGLSFAMGDSTFSASGLSKSLGWAKLRLQLRDPDGPPPDWARPITDSATVILERVDVPTPVARAKAALLATRYKRRIEAHEVGFHIRWIRLHSDGLELLLRDGTRLIESHHGTKITLIGDRSQAAVQELVLAAQRGGWKAMKLTSGDAAFKRAVLIEASRVGLRITNPELQASMRTVRLAGERLAAQTARPAQEQDHHVPSGETHAHRRDGSGHAESSFSGRDGAGPHQGRSREPIQGDSGFSWSPDGGGVGLGQGDDADAPGPRFGGPIADSRDSDDLLDLPVSGPAPAPSTPPQKAGSSGPEPF